jgi:hypothetical protein
MTENTIAKEIVDAAFRIHTTLGPGLLESVYHAVLAYELAQRGLRTVSQQAIPVVYGTIRMDIGFRPAHQFQRGAHQGWHFPYRQWTGRRVSRKAARTPRTRVKVRLFAVLSA